MMGLALLLVGAQGICLGLIGYLAMALRLPNPLRLHLHGPGRAAVSLAILAMQEGAVTVGMSGGSPLGAEEAQAALGGASAGSARVPWSRDFGGVAAGTWVVLGVPDDALPGVVAELAQKPFDKSTLVLHLSGRQGCGVLEPLRAQGASVGALHPLRSFPTRMPSASSLEGAVVGLSDAACPGVNDALHHLAQALGGRPWVLSDEKRALYHAGAALVGNGVLALLDAGKRAMMAAGLPENLALDALVTLAVKPLEHASVVGSQAALTGPVVRGDSETLTSHIAALGEHQSEDRDLYLEVARSLVELSKGRLAAERASLLRHLLSRFDAGGSDS